MNPKWSNNLQNMLLFSFYCSIWRALYGQDLWYGIPKLVKYWVTWWLKNSVPLSDLTHFIVTSNWVFTWTINLFNNLNVSILECIKLTQVYLLKSSTMVRKYLWPWWVGILYGPQTSKWIKSKLLLLTESPFGNGVLCCLDCEQKMHEEIFFSFT